MNPEIVDWEVSFLPHNQACGSICAISEVINYKYEMVGKAFTDGEFVEGRRKIIVKGIIKM